MKCYFWNLSIIDENTKNSIIYLILTALQLEFQMKDNHINYCKILHQSILFIHYKICKEAAILGTRIIIKVTFILINKYFCHYSDMAPNSSSFKA